jgi:predicted nucleic acid-binding protein
MFILDTDHISLFQRRDPHVTARVLATSALELATTVITVEGHPRKAGHIAVDRVL